MKLFIGDCLTALPWFMGAVTVRAVLPRMQRPSMKTSHGERTKEHDAVLIKAIEAHQRIIDKVCYAFCRRRADRKDLYQEILCQVWVSYPKFKQGSKFTTWLYSVALHSATVWQRKIQHRIIEYRDELPELPGDHPMDQGFSDRIDRLFSRLDVTERAIVTLLMEGYTREEIGSILKVGTAAVTMRMSRLRKEIIHYKQDAL
jgi:RNA polymerase sigma factor (sigma-70 family)